MTIGLVNGSKLECVIDTGFNGFLLLPRKFIEDNSLDIIGTESIIMVEQNATEVEVAAGEVNWFGTNVFVKILVSEHDESLVGTQMLEGSKLEIDYRNMIVRVTR
jgi:clan AA aspartic protease